MQMMSMRMTMIRMDEDDGEDDLYLFHTRVGNGLDSQTALVIKK